MSKPFALALAASIAFAAVACAAVDPFGDGPTTDQNATASKCKSKKKSKKKSTAKESESGLEPTAKTEAASAGVGGVDPSTLEECEGTKGTKGRCVPNAALGAFGGKFEAGDCGDDMSCVPDEIVKNGTSVKLKSCEAITGVEGRCFWPLAKDIVEKYDLLKSATKDQCEDDQVCAPCVNPLTKEETGICKLGGAGGSASDDDEECEDDDKGNAGAGGDGNACPQVEPSVDVSGFSQEECSSNMLCVDENLVGKDRADKLQACSKGRCAPKKSVERGGNYVPKTCRSTNDSEGRCMNVGVPMIGEKQDLLPQGDCDEDERCAPCFDPRTGEESGACRTAPCDAPKEPAKELAQCCGGRARCVSAAQAGESADKLAADSCTGDTPLCAPVEFVGSGATVRKCSTIFGLVGGVCVSKCSMTISIKDLVQGDCPDGDMCAPCMMLPESVTACQQ